MIAFHAIITTYGFWLPNDPRGSWSTYVGSAGLYRVAGEATKVSTTRSVANREHDTRLRIAAKSYLRYPAVQFTGGQAQAVADGFRSVAQASGYSILGLAVMPTHVHAVIGASDREPGRIIGHLKRGATNRLIEEAVHPCLSNQRITHSCWAKQAWKVFIDSEEHLDQAIRYVEDNPIKGGKPPQYWAFVKSHRERWFASSAPASGPANRNAVPR